MIAKMSKISFRKEAGGQISTTSTLFSGSASHNEVSEALYPLPQGKEQIVSFRLDSVKGVGHTTLTSWLNYDLMYSISRF
jgi:hypothetical protein